MANRAILLRYLGWVRGWEGTAPLIYYPLAFSPLI